MTCRSVDSLGVAVDVDKLSVGEQLEQQLNSTRVPDAGRAFHLECAFFVYSATLTHSHVCHPMHLHRAASLSTQLTQPPFKAPAPCTLWVKWAYAGDLRRSRLPAARIVSLRHIYKNDATQRAVAAAGAERKEK